jgi:hypothetical protein
MKYTLTKTLHGEVHRSGLVLDNTNGAVLLVDLMPPEALTSPRPGTFVFEVTFVPDLTEEARKAVQEVMDFQKSECVCMSPNEMVLMAEKIGDIVQQALDQQASKIEGRLPSTPPRT